MPGPVIIGGGPAGAAAAIALARAGREVTLIERHAAPADKVCGDFLSARAVAAVAALGIDLTPAAPITRLRLIHRRRIVATRLPFAACGLSRRVLDEALLGRAQAAGATVLRGQRVGSVAPDRGGLRLDCSMHGRIVTDTVLLATGKHELPGAERASRGTGLVGMKMYYRLEAAQTELLRDHIELTLFADGYAGLQLVEADRAVLCMLLPSALVRGLAGDWNRLVESLADGCPHLAQRLSGGHAMLARPLAVSGLPYGFVHAAGERDLPGLYRVGDQAAVIPSLAGDGVALALASGSSAARMWLAGAGSPDYHRQRAACVATPMRVAAMLHRLCLDARVQPWLMAACAAWPGVLRLAAAATRTGGADM
ncbi:MAG: FAD-dependent oxidoreductase [Acetobacteraceae bacterium]